MSRDHFLNLIRRMDQRANYQRTTVTLVSLVSALLSSPDRRSTSPDLIIVLKKQWVRSSYLRFADVNYVDATLRTSPSRGQASTISPPCNWGPLSATKEQRWTKPLGGRLNSQSRVLGFQYQLAQYNYSWAPSFTRMPAHHHLHSLARTAMGTV